MAAIAICSSASVASPWLNRSRAAAAAAAAAAPRRPRPRDGEHGLPAMAAGVGGGSAGLGVVVTGGTKGFGYATASEFLEAGDRVLVCGRDEARLHAAVQSLGSRHGARSVHGRKCDVSKSEDVSAFAASAACILGTVHIWINNAGDVTSKRLLSDLDSEQVARVCNTNVLGSLLCCRESIRLMAAQPSSPFPVYHIFNMGFSPWGAKFTKSACTHKATKVALTQLTESLKEELLKAGVLSIGVHNLSPGMMITDLLLKDSTPADRRFFNILAEEPQTVAAALVPIMRNIQGSGQSISYLTPLSAIWKLLVGFPQVLTGGRFFDKYGNRIQIQGCQFQENGVRVLY